LSEGAVPSPAVIAPPPALPEWRRRLRRWRYRFSLQQFVAELLEKRWMEPAIPLGLLGALIVFFSVTVPTFATTANALSTERELAEFSLVCLGMTIVIVSGGIDLSVGSTFAVANMTALILLKLAGWPAPAVVAVTLALGALLGACNGWVVAYLKARPFLTTLVTLIIFRGVVNLLDLRYSPQLATRFIDSPSWNWLGAGALAGLPSGMGVLVIVFAAAHVLISRSRLGWHITAVGASRRAARHAGIDVERVLMTSYVLSGMLCAGAALFYASRLDSSSSRTGEGMELGALTAVVLGGISLSGGKGTAARALIGASVVTLLGKGLLLMNVTGSIYSTLLAAVLLVAVGADVKWAKNRGKTIQKIYVNPTIIESGVLPDISAGSASPYAQNTRLRDAEAIGLGQVEGPEDVICDEEGRLYCGDRRGWIMRFSGPRFERREVFARIGGMPLGLAFDRDRNLVACIGGMGLYAVTPAGEVRKLTDETNRSWSRLKDDSRLRLADDLDVTPDGKIYFSEATIRFEADQWILDGIEGRPNGRVICYDPATRTTRTVLPRLVFPNGVCSCHDGESILIGQTWLCRILRYWHSGAKRGALEVFADDLPGYVDNINRASDGGYWVALTGTRAPIYDLSMRMPSFRRRMMKRVPPDEWLYPSLNHGCVLKIGEDAKVVESYWDPGGESHATITSMREFEGHLYIGGLTNNRIGRVRLAPAARLCRCGQRPCARPGDADEAPARRVGT
jgi:ribose transport system permease protein